MTEVAAADARANWSETLDAASKQPVCLTRRGRTVGVLVSPDLWARAVEALEDAEDVAAARAARVEGGTPTPWDEVKRDLGLA